MTAMKPNPLYILSRQDQNILLDHFFPDNAEAIPGDGTYDFTIAYGSFNGRDDDTNFLGYAESLLGRAIADGQGEPSSLNRIIFILAVPTRMRQAHVIHPTGSVEFDFNHSANQRPGFRRYYDGTEFYIQHATAMCVDIPSRRVFLQDPKGVDVNVAAPHLQNLLVFYEQRGFAILNLNIPQQDNEHDCAIFTIANVIDFARGQMPDPHADAQELRAEYMDILNEYYKNKRAPSVIEEGVPFQRFVPAAP